MVIENTYRLLEEIVKTQNKSGRKLWWRGQPKSRCGLTPRIYRGNWSTLYEMSITSYFSVKAPVRYPNCPTNEVDWLFLMQHYGLPTRLLDWTESPLTALFFTVWEPGYDSESADLWALNAPKLNAPQIGQEMVVIPPQGYKVIRRIAKDAFRGIQRDDSNEILAIYPPHTDIRMLVQQSVFTIHATRTPLDQLENKEEFLWKIEIPPHQKEHLRNFLLMFGITHSTLFPDLEHLAEDLASREYV